MLNQSTHITVPNHIKLQFIELTAQLKENIEEELMDQTPLLLDDCYCDFYELLTECYINLTKKNYLAVNQIVELFYTKWIALDRLPCAISSEVNAAVSRATASMLLSCYCAQLMSMSCYSTSAALGMVCLSIGIKIIISNPMILSLSMLNCGLFYVKSIKPHRVFKNRC